jgi:hypothetical protein
MPPLNNAHHHNLRGTLTPQTCLTLAHSVGEAQIGNLRPFSL